MPLASAPATVHVLRAPTVEADTTAVLNGLTSQGRDRLHKVLRVSHSQQAAVRTGPTIQMVCPWPGLTGDLER